MEGSLKFLVVIVCPHTGMEVPTGITTDISLGNLPDGLRTLNCPECGEKHEWSRREALLAYSHGGLDNWRPSYRRDDF